MKPVALGLLFSLFTVGLLCSCSRTTQTPAQVVGRTFPEVTGSSLTKATVRLPQDLAGKPAVVLIGYQQKTQFDIDRWILGILQADIPVQIVEVPTIPGMMPQMVQQFITNGMRRGIPEEDWASVVTVFEDAPKIIAAFGNERPQSAQVVALGRSGEILWTSNRGYSPSQVLELKKLFAQKNAK